MSFRDEPIPPGRELDIEVAKSVFGWACDAYTGALVPPNWQPSVDTLDVTIPYYSTDIAAAWKVLEHLGLTFEVTYVRSLANYSIRIMDSTVIGGAQAATVAHVICLAALSVKRYYAERAGEIIESTEHSC